MSIHTFICIYQYKCHIRTWGGGNFKIMSLFAIRKDSIALRASYEIYYFIEKFKLALNKRHR